MLYREIIALFWGPYKRHKYRVWADVELFNVNPGGTYSDHWTLER